MGDIFTSGWLTRNYTDLSWAKSMSDIPWWIFITGIICSFLRFVWNCPAKGLESKACFLCCPGQLHRLLCAIRRWPCQERQGEVQKRRPWKRSKKSKLRG
jgi:uncharacterized membrane protein YdcZ (DUF606 family)